MEAWLMEVDNNTLSSREQKKDTPNARPAYRINMPTSRALSRNE
jgi:hypothetical protein